MPKIIIIGGSGFIGSRLLQLLLSSYKEDELLVIDKVEPRIKNIPYVICDIRNKSKLLEVTPPAKVLINLAAEHKDNVEPKNLYDEVNVQGASNICEVAEEKSIDAIVFTSSVAIYGFAPKGTDESGEVNYFNDYGRTKWLAEEVYREWQEKSSERKLSIVRPTVIFGERNRGNVYNLLKQIVHGPFIMIGNGKNVKSMAYVENIVAFLKFCIENPKPNQVFNYVDKPDLSMNELLDSIFGFLGKERKKVFRLPYWLGLVGGFFLDVISKIVRRKFAISAIRVKKFHMDTMFGTSIGKTNFKAPVPLADGLKNTIRYEFLEDNNESLFYTE